MSSASTNPTIRTDDTDRVAVLDAQVLDAETHFFSSLLAGDTPTLAQVLADEFTLIDVGSGRLVDRAEFLGAVQAGDVHFTGIDRDPAHTSIRHRPGISVVVGLTRMTMTVGPAEIAVRSRYTHVYKRARRGWQLLAAQGTPIAQLAPAR